MIRREDGGTSGFSKSKLEDKEPCHILLSLTTATRMRSMYLLWITPLMSPRFEASGGCQRCHGCMTWTRRTPRRRKRRQRKRRRKEEVAEKDMAEEEKEKEKKEEEDLNEKIPFACRPGLFEVAISQKSKPAIKPISALCPFRIFTNGLL
ncbi:hypothetical protein EYF80_005044 [Liparis tanakae]|uniref:Uncharacterized protein n=1 Tax=Liparis tanakae TaxID=230148 RepID=A0A4Z2J337_9TELE|nr:hypothetical protein EYF80_005044 [Liparis tanakae]